MALPLIMTMQTSTTAIALISRTDPPAPKNRQQRADGRAETRSRHGSRPDRHWSAPEILGPHQSQRDRSNARPDKRASSPIATVRCTRSKGDYW